MQKSRITKELSKLDEKAYEYSCNKNEKNIEIVFLTNYGNIIMDIPRSYPFTPPKVYISNYNSFETILPLYKLKLFFKNKLNNDIIEKIYDYLQVVISDKIIYKKYLHDLMNFKTNIKNIDILWKYDDMLMTGWSPMYYIYNIIDFLINFNNLFKLKKKFHLKLVGSI